MFVEKKSCHICWKCFPQVVLADGRVARVTSRSALVENENGTRSEYKFTPDTDLWFAMRGAGSSYGTYLLLSLICSMKNFFQGL